MAWGIRPFQFARLLVLIDADMDVCDTEHIVATIINKAHWADIFAMDSIRGPMGFPHRRVAIDATRDLAGRKRAVPQTPDPATVNLVTNRWPEYGLGPESEP